MAEFSIVDESRWNTKDEIDQRGPAEGYLFPEKQFYREEVWDIFTEHCPVPLTDAHVLLLPAKEGAEIGVALAHGFREDHIHAVDENKAILATAKWRAQYPGVNIYGNRLPRALERIKEEGIQLSAVSFDFCNKFSWKLVQELREMGKHSEAFHDKCVFAITCFKGREKADVFALLSLLEHDSRVDVAGDVLFTELDRAYQRLRLAEYRSNQTMQYGIFRTATHSFMERHHDHVEQMWWDTLDPFIEKTQELDEFRLDHLHDYWGKMLTPEHRKRYKKRGEEFYRRGYALEAEIEVVKQRCFDALSPMDKYQNIPMGYKGFHGHSVVRWYPKSLTQGVGHLR